MWKVKAISFVVACCFVGLVQCDIEDDGYSGEVKKLFQDLKDFGFGSNVEQAQRKMGSFLDETMDRKYAIGLVNLYTQDENKFYQELNIQMRKNYPADTNIWKRSGDLINRGIDILGSTAHTIVYRGCTELNDLPVIGSTFKFNQIISTTLNRKTAEYFTNCEKGILFEISNVYGLLVDDYSEYGYEEEVMIQSYYVFKVLEERRTTEGYTIYKLDGQSESINSGNRAYAGILMQCSIVVIAILTLGK